MARSLLSSSDDKEVLLKFILFRKCYQPFETEDALTEHINMDHEGRIYI
jgi:hypothetical protein